MPLVIREKKRRIWAYKKRVPISQEMMDFIVAMRAYGVPLTKMCCVSFMPSMNTVRTTMKKNEEFFKDLQLVQSMNPVRGRHFGPLKKKQ